MKENTIFDEMIPEAEVSLRIASHLLSLPKSDDIAEVHIDKGQLTWKKTLSYPIGRVFANLGMKPIQTSYEFPWFGSFKIFQNKMMHIGGKRSGLGDVVVRVGDFRFRVQCKGWTYYYKWFQQRASIPLGITWSNSSFSRCTAIRYNGCWRSIQ